MLKLTMRNKPILQYEKVSIDTAASLCNITSMLYVWCCKSVFVNVCVCERETGAAGVGFESDRPKAC